MLSNLVNYRSFGFTKIIPRISDIKFEAVVQRSANSNKALDLWYKVWQPSFVEPRAHTLGLQLKEHIYATEPSTSLFIGKRSEGHVSNYYLGEVISDEEVGDVQTAAENLGVDVLNTR